MIERALAALEAAGDREVWTGLDASGEVEQRLGARALAGRIGAWQDHLDRNGVRPGQRVAIDLPRSPDLLAAHLAVLASGACAVPLNPALRPAERERVLARAEPSCLLDSAESAGRPTPARLAPVAAERPALLIFTSGTTGEPKGVPLSLANMEANLEALASTWQLSEEDRLLHALPAHHVHGLVLALYGSVRLALPIVALPRFDAALCLESIERRGVTVFMGVPTMYHRLVKCPVRAQVAGVRVFISGSAPLSPRDFHAFRGRFGHAPLERYGLSETLIVSSNPLHGERRAGTVGHALPRSEVRLAPDGEIEVRGAAVMAGYWRDARATAQVFDGSWFRTGDLGEYDLAGYLRISGRKKELIIVGGSNVLPGEVELALGETEGVADLAVAGLPDPDRGEVVAAFVCADPAADPAELEERLRERAEERLAGYKRPRVYRFVDELPRNSMGKVDRRALRSSV